MNLIKSKKVQVGWRWRCSRPCLKEKGLFENTFFSNSNIQLHKLIIMIYYWSFEECTFKKVERDLGLQEHSFVDWRNYLREVCALQMMSLEMQLGGEGIEVQIDEPLFVRRKYDRGRLLREQWIFGAIDCSTKESICIPVENRKKETLIPLIL
ncbi:hypothetical protein H312_01336 [Anncaliia algerae PRA339]|uniref:ISXO2-like transposase domain-containing protein n=1 Tax=Anncaliia algerae PRA339 TaxID=1288291 RepID=A0A059F1T8_9MICR|nr:hypothetical protein H312_01336 [Anncaliia algerae PRA339]